MAINFPAAPPPIPVITPAPTTPVPPRRAAEQIIERPVIETPESELPTGEELETVREERRAETAAQRRDDADDVRPDRVGERVDIRV